MRLRQTSRCVPPYGKRYHGTSQQRYILCGETYLPVFLYEAIIYHVRTRASRLFCIRLATSHAETPFCLRHKGPAVAAFPSTFT